MAEQAQTGAQHYPKGLVVIAYHGTGKGIKYPGEDWQHFDPKSGKSIGDLLDDVEKSRGDAPVAIFGYSQMIRGESFRNNRRVPTHIIVALGGAQTVDKLVQCVGRASGEFRTQLRRNGFPNGVTLLMPYSDYDAVKAYLKFQQEVVKLQEGGHMSFDGILAGGIQAPGTKLQSKRSVGANALALDQEKEVATTPVPWTQEKGHRTKSSTPIRKHHKKSSSRSPR